VLAKQTTCTVEVALGIEIVVDATVTTISEATDRNGISLVEVSNTPQVKLLAMQSIGFHLLRD